LSDKEKTNVLAVTSSPHFYDTSRVPRIMRDVFIALLPATLVGIWHFGVQSLLVVLLSIISCVLVEAIAQKMLGKAVTVNDWSAALTGLLLALNLPGNAPWWLVLTGAVVAIYLGKQIFGGLGHNPFNPALVARVFLLISFPMAMTSWPKALSFPLKFNVMTQATPLGILKTDGVAKAMASTSYLDLFFGRMGGCIGEISAAALLLGGIYLMAKKIISWEIPLSFIATVFVISGVFHLLDPGKYADPLFHILAGGLFLGAFFMATDYVTSPMALKGRLLFGFLCGLITVVIRLWGGYPEGVSFAILFMNGLVPLIDKYMLPKKFGRRVGR